MHSKTLYRITCRVAHPGQNLHFPKTLKIPPSDILWHFVTWMKKEGNALVLLSPNFQKAPPFALRND